MQNNNMMTLGPAQVQKAAAKGAELLNTKGAVNVDGPTALSGDLQILNIILTNLASGAVILATPEKDEELPEEPDPDIPDE